MTDNDAMTHEHASSEATSIRDAATDTPTSRNLPPPGADGGSREARTQAGGTALAVVPDDERSDAAALAVFDTIIERLTGRAPGCASGQGQAEGRSAQGLARGRARPARARPQARSAMLYHVGRA